MTCVYLDNNATTQPADAVIDAICEVNTELWANPSSVHRFGQMVRQRLDLARADVAKLIPLTWAVVTLLIGVTLVALYRDIVDFPDLG